MEKEGGMDFAHLFCITGSDIWTHEMHTSSTDIKTHTYRKKPCWWIFLQRSNGLPKFKESSNNKEKKKRGKKSSRKISELEKVANIPKKISLLQNVTNSWNKDDEDSYAWNKKKVKKNLNLVEK